MLIAVCSAHHATPDGGIEDVTTREKWSSDALADLDRDNPGAPWPALPSVPLLIVARPAARANNRVMHVTPGKQRTGPGASKGYPPLHPAPNAAYHVHLQHWSTAAPLLFIFAAPHFPSPSIPTSIPPAAPQHSTASPTMPPSL
jgi:hypothetical protein